MSQSFSTGVLEISVCCCCTVQKRKKLFRVKLSEVLAEREPEAKVQVCALHFVCVRVTSAINHTPQCPCSSNTYHENQCWGQVEQSCSAPENTTAANICSKCTHQQSEFLTPLTHNVCVVTPIKTPVPKSPLLK